MTTKRPSNGAEHHHKLLNAVKVGDKSTSEMLTIIKIDAGKPSTYRPFGGTVTYVCECLCGNTRIVKPYVWLSGEAQSCGCKHSSLAFRKARRQSKDPFEKAKKAPPHIKAVQSVVWLLDSRNSQNNQQEQRDVDSG